MFWYVSKIWFCDIKKYILPYHKFDFVKSQNHGYFFIFVTSVIPKIQFHDITNSVTKYIWFSHTNPFENLIIKYFFLYERTDFVI